MTTNENQTVQTPVAAEFSISREFDAPLPLVFKAWSEAEHLAKWWGPNGFNIEVKTLDFRPGGMFHYYLKNDAGMEMWGKFVYREIEAPNRIVYVSSFSDAAGRVTRAFFSESFPLEVLNILSFSEENGKTTVTLRGCPLNASAE
jgi:uncharacterized protein YndB with AHSA1/START domain